MAPRKSSEVCNVQAQWVRQKYKQCGSQVKFCRDPLESGKPPWISTTKKDQSVWATTACRASRSEQSLKFRIIRLAGTPQSTSAKVARSALTARTTVKQNTIHRHPDCTTCQLNLSKHVGSEYCTPLRVNEQGGQAERNVMQPHVPSVKVPYLQHQGGKPYGMPDTHEGPAHANGSNTNDSRPCHG